MRKIKIKVNQSFAVSNIILKIEFVYGKCQSCYERVEDFEYVICAFHSA